MSKTIDENRTVKIFPCPVCRTMIRYTKENPFRPFCSRRCRMIDLGQWLEEDYRVHGETAPDAPDEC